MPLLPRLAAALVVLVSSLAAFDFTALQPQGYLSDFSGVVDAASRQAIERYCSEVERATGAQIALVTLPTLQGEPVEDVANALFRKWGIGKKGKDEGILLLLVTQDRKSRLEVGYGLEPLIPDGFAGSVLRAMRPALQARRYGEAMRTATAVIGQRIAEGKGVSIGTSPPARRQTRPEQGIPWPMLVGGLVLLLLLFGRGGGGRRGGYGGGMGGFLPGLILGNMMGGGFGHRGGGGFGGYDSGGGFGGFGGGDSGGGGASSDW